MEEETIDLVMSLTGAKFSRELIAEAIKKHDGDADDAIEYLVNQSRQEMFSAKALAQNENKPR